ncbi:hypothetical protein HLB44_14575 [Aquincola sp. S2]|uniref:Uncharacterized protein n=1 Tax=Pseudaquabacterium terrae TaxID=2732868 RepID=A0ABX2EHZ0_9BURK|nr:hypothetical protein [Aquabacterium terrae]NRF68215.1 hypothetical protein [Aquabacterium terrae]
MSSDAQRPGGPACSAQARLPTYQELLDETLENTFPASDPIAAGAAMHACEPRTTARDQFDWTLGHGIAEPGCAERSAPQPALIADPACGPIAPPTLTALFAPLLPRPGRATPPLPDVLPAIPHGPCEIEQTSDAATVRWQQDGRPHAMVLSLGDLQQLMARGFIRRADAA